MLNTKAIIINETGDANVLKLQEHVIGAPGPNQVLISHKAIGVNFLDIYYRKGLHKLDNLPAILGTEACGYIEKLGQGVTGFKVGDKVAYATSITGAYCRARIIDTKYLVGVPDVISDELAAAFLAKGLTAHFLLKRCYFLRKDDTILVHAAAGGVGRILCQWAKYIGAKVIGTVGSDEKVKIAKASGCTHVINYNKSNFKDEVLAIAPEGVGVVYDAVGKDTFLDSVACLKKFGLMVSYGQASGAIDPVDISIFSKKSTFFTRPSLFDYKSNRMELVLGAAEVFEMIKNKRFKLEKYNSYSLDNVAQAHTDIELRKTTGSTILTT
jgi:NADPH2:quinone reductase